PPNPPEPIDPDLDRHTPPELDVATSLITPRGRASPVLAHCGSRSPGVIRTKSSCCGGAAADFVRISGGPEGKLRGRPPPPTSPRSEPWRRTGSESDAGRARTRRRLSMA